MIYFALCILFNYRKKSKYLQKKNHWYFLSDPFDFQGCEKRNRIAIHTYIFMSNCSIKLEGNQSTSSSRMIAAVKTYHNTSKSVNCLLLESVSGLIYPYQFKQLKSNYVPQHGAKVIMILNFHTSQFLKSRGFNFACFSFSTK